MVVVVVKRRLQMVVGMVLPTAHTLCWAVR
jgi:hypothetical protein